MATRVLTFHNPGEPDQLTCHELPSVALRRGHVRIAVSAIGLNFAEIVQISGAFQIPAPTPPVPGFELSGTLTEILDDVPDLTVGQRVMALVGWGAYTDELVVPAAHVLPVPAGMDDFTAAAFPVSYAAAHVSLRHRGRLCRGETAVVTGPTGNVGSAALQVARAVGAIVIAVDRSGTLGPGIADHVIGGQLEAAANHPGTTDRSGHTISTPHLPPTSPQISPNPSTPRN